jgi:dihydrofolate reductase
MTTPRLAYVVALDANRLIGRDNALPWRLPDDLRWFRARTMGKPCIMGRKTYDSLPDRFRPLPGRLNIVVTRQRDYTAPGAVVVHSLADALAAAGPAPEVIIVGGADLFRAFLSRVDRLYLTELDGAAEAQPGARDVFFPDISAIAWREVYRQHHPADDRHPFAFTWRILEREEMEPQITQISQIEEK